MALSRDQLIEIVANLGEAYASIPAEKRQSYQAQFLEVIQALQPHLEALGTDAQEPPQESPEDTTPAPVPSIARTLWILARGNTDVFEAYLKSYPDANLQALGQNPSAVNNLIQQLSQKLPIPSQAERGGFETPDGKIQPAPLQSSNVYGFRYDPFKKRLTVRFQRGDVYRYDGVPPVIFDMFRHGQGVARTKGSNEYGRWWVGKNPSLGASLYELIKLGNYPYQRIR